MDMFFTVPNMQMTMTVLNDMGMGVSIMGVGDSVCMEMPMLHHQCIR